ncbi:MAG: thiamine phosphate synthase [Zoogloeaceae bacterium]|nr:thiamine phosphate synthase [Rhodocyclaceae bacterium]MCP5235303.1 thiamine phosphate synthase [Zoogloeaceae bacterium]
MSWRDGGLYLVTRDCTAGDRLLAEVEQALQGRPALLQYRSKLPDRDLRRQQASAVLALCRSHGVPMLVNDNVELALAIGADGAHIGGGDGEPAEVRAALGAGRILGVSCYDAPDRALAAQRAGADYVAFGAMFSSPTKPDAVRAPIAMVRRAAGALEVPVAAIGGITLDNARELVAAGVSLLAVISDVFEHPSPARRAAAYRTLFEPHSRLRDDQ